MKTDPKPGLKLLVIDNEPQNLDLCRPLTITKTWRCCIPPLAAENFSASRLQ
jgi:hypothetical protein